jgi:hypothetical protein
VNVAPLFANYVELVEEKHARYCAHVIEHARQALRRLPQKTADQLFIPYGHQRQPESFGDRFGKCRLAVSGWSRQQDAMPRLDSMRPQKVSPMLLLDEVLDLRANNFWNHQLGKASLRM